MNNRPGSILKTTQLIHSYDIDVRGKAKPGVLFNYMLDIAWNHVKSTDFSYSALLEQGQLWIASKIFILFYGFPRWNDRVIVKTWGKGLDRFYALRDFVICTDENKKLASATSSWLIIDQNKFRPQKLDKLLRDFPFEMGKNELDVKLEKIPPLSNGEINSQYTVCFTDLDINRHANASKYMEWILNSFPSEVLENKDLKSFEINFLSEAQLNDEISVSTELVDEFHLCRINRNKDGKEICRARVVWGDPAIAK